ncbi:serine/threonine-protein kinase NIM1-like [Hyalella azteca]|uniref:non-specific serine/threonine protein kinase n=1 Tax=Hyalella azteca TaxID=294128 RepID=A0A8B7NUJ8_HYAAZ|nr:serine/threonine-protein kinase NIM1-like [Hyalella azteca]
MLVTSSALPGNRMQYTRHEVARNSSTRSTSSTGDGYTSEAKNLGAYERCLYSLAHDPRWQKESLLGRRVGLYRFRGELGQGNFSTVRLAFHQLTRDKVAVKVIDKTKLDPRTQRMLAREISNMDAVAHPNIIRLFEVVETVSKIHLVLEYAGGGELFNFISTEGKLKEGDAVAVFSQLLSAVSYLHALSIVHRDIKAENVFITRRLRVKLGDLGFSTRISEPDQPLTTFCGSPPYAAPELYKDASYAGPGVDVWALGILLFFILTAEMPFRANTVSALKRHILAGAFTFPSHVSPAAQDLIKKILVQEPHLRLTTAGIAEHDLLSGVHPSLPQHRSPSHLCPAALSPSSQHVHSAPSSPSSHKNFLETPDHHHHHNHHHHSDDQHGHSVELLTLPDDDSSQSSHQHSRNKARRSSSARSASPRDNKTQSRRHSCMPRSSSLKSQSSSFGFRAFPSSPLPHYVNSPQTDVSFDLLTESEIESLAMLDHWGISKNALSEASPLGARSPIVGTYRILLHRILNRGQDAEDEQTEAETTQQNRSKSEDRLSSARKSIRSTSPLKHRLKLMNNAYTSENSRSRTCTII